MRYKPAPDHVHAAVVTLRGRRIFVLWDTSPVAAVARGNALVAALGWDHAEVSHAP